MYTRSRAAAAAATAGDEPLLQDPSPPPSRRNPGEPPEPPPGFRSRSTSTAASPARDPLLDAVNAFGTAACDHVEALMVLYRDDAETPSERDDDCYTVLAYRVPRAAFPAMVETCKAAVERVDDAHELLYGMEQICGRQQQQQQSQSQAQSSQKSRSRSGSVAGKEKKRGGIGLLAYMSRLLHVFTVPWAASATTDSCGLSQGSCRDSEDAESGLTLPMAVQHDVRTRTYVAVLAAANACVTFRLRDDATAYATTFDAVTKLYSSLVRRRR